jgi:hypothetical protein
MENKTKNCCKKPEQRKVPDFEPPLCNQETNFVPNELGALKAGLISTLPCTPTQFPIRNREVRSQLQLPQKKAAAACGASCWDFAELLAVRSGEEGEAGSRTRVFIWLLVVVSFLHGPAGLQEEDAYHCLRERVMAWWEARGRSAH